MTTADYALIVSVMSFVVSLGGLWWNIWSKFIYPKAKIQMSFRVMTVVGGVGETDFLSLTATNHGPSDLTLHTVVSRSPRDFDWRRLKRRWQYAVMNPLHSTPGDREYTIGPFSGGLPKKVAVGEQFSSNITFDHESLAEQNIIDVGFVDIFGRHHWASRNAVRDVCDKIRSYRAQAHDGAQ